MQLFPDVDGLVDRLERCTIAEDDLVRYREDIGDDEASAIVRSVAGMDDTDRDEFRARESAEMAATLGLFAKRRVVKARKQSSLELVHDAIIAYALIAHVADVPWQTWLRAALVLAAPLGEDPDEVVDLFAGSPSPARSRAKAVVDAVERTNDLSDCHLVEVTTTYGLGILELPIAKDVATFALRGAPLIDHNLAEYRPTSNLAQTAVHLADAFDATPSIHTGAITFSQLASQYFSLVVSGSWLPAVGCLRFSATTIAGSTFDVFVAEMSEDFDMDGMEEYAATDDGQGAFVEGRRLVLISPEPNFDDVLAPLMDVHVYETMAREALRTAT